MQQLVKLAVSEQVKERVVILADSDVAFIRPVTETTFATDGRVRFYRQDNGVTSSHVRHRLWHTASRQILGLPPPPTGLLTDYIAPLNSWDSDVVGDMLRHVASINKRPWLDVIGGRLHFSEFTLYGIFCDSTMSGANLGAPSDDDLCNCYWDDEPLTEGGAQSFASKVRLTDVAVMISAKSATPLATRRAVLQDLDVK